MSTPAIVVEGLSKQYHIGARENQKTFREAITDALAAPFRRVRAFGRSSYREEDTIWALKDVSFEVQPGEVVGIIGRNGAGKSTLLKILTRITEPTEGRAILNGRVGSLLEVGTGFHSELTGRENIYLSGAILGMGKQEIKRKFDEIVDFSGVEKFIDTPVKRYSSGMRVRLGFAVAAHLDPEILLIDEVLAVGDAEFQKKCLGKMDAVAKGGRTVLFVSHNMGAVSSLCGRALQLDEGAIVRQGAAVELTQRYLSTLLDRSEIDLRNRTDRRGSGRIRIVQVSFENGLGQQIDSAMAGQKLRVVLHYEVAATATQAAFAIGFYNISGVPIFRCATHLCGISFAQLAGRGSAVCTMPKLALPVGNYRLNVAVSEYETRVADHIEGAATLHVEPGDFYGSGRIPPSRAGVALVEHHWALRSDADWRTHSLGHQPDLTTDPS